MKKALLTARERRAFCEDLVRYQLHELNGLGDRIRFLRRGTSPNPAHLAEAWRRCRTILDALAWSAQDVLPVLERWLRSRDGALLERPEDAFAPTLLFRTLEPRHRGFRRWAAALPPAARLALVQSGLPLLNDGASTFAMPKPSPRDRNAAPRMLSGSRSR